MHIVGFDYLLDFKHNDGMRYTIECGTCGKEITVMGENDEKGMENMKEEAKSHNSLRHPEEKQMSDTELEEDIKGKWKKEE